ncbi:uncharacterized protein LOC121267310 [Juglans microcarpa x Juglans regia]|uniref:uncharacterized protein LOC121267310 n=1 Tax=Juglans microcarpa x Juglans regia TaxID=2249226 RepID=UPI001B7DED91|nr:uncharacterized protein LOC121267310 [Juglans microcarpa x Juglans regia]
MTAMITKLTWFRSHSILHGKEFHHPRFLITKALEDYYLFQMAQERKSSPSVTVVQKSAWIKPPADWFKMNWDASCAQSRGRVGIEVIIRYTSGQVIGCCRDSKPLVVNSFMAEVVALQVAMNFCKDMGIKMVKLEGDSLQVVQYLQKDSHDMSPVGLLLEDKKLLLKSFAQWSIHHTNRLANEGAHYLAQDAI